MFVSSSMIPARCVENINFHRYVKSLNPDVRQKFYMANFILLLYTVSNAISALDH